MVTYEIIENSLLTEKQTIDICQIKNLSWQYGLKSQLEWLQNNLQTNDKHFLLYEDDCLKGYLNLINVEIMINGSTVNAFGIGNVCVAEKKSGWGKTLLNTINQYLLADDIIGLLFCKASLVIFYEKANWTLIPKNLINFAAVQHPSFETMIYNYLSAIETIEYSGLIF